MSESKAAIHTKRFIRCPSCGEGEHSVEHLLTKEGDGDRTAGPWWCDYCDRSFLLRYTRDEVFVEVWRERRKSQAVLLRLDVPSDATVYFIMDSTNYSFDRSRLDDPSEGHRFYYESHSCPTNWIGTAEAIVVDRGIGHLDTDPHGILRYVGHVDGDAREIVDPIKQDGMGTEEGWRELLGRLGASGDDDEDGDGLLH